MFSSLSLFCCRFVSVRSFVPPSPFIFCLLTKSSTLCKLLSMCPRIKTGLIPSRLICLAQRERRWPEDVWSEPSGLTQTRRSELVVFLGPTFLSSPEPMSTSLILRATVGWLPNFRYKNSRIRYIVPSREIVPRFYRLNLIYTHAEEEDEKTIDFCTCLPEVVGCIVRRISSSHFALSKRTI